MVGKKSILGAVLAVAAVYLAYPYVTLYRLGQAIRSGDAASLEAMVDWYAVREGIKEDICDFVIDQPTEAKTTHQLPPFGAGFIRGIASNTVDTRVTPRGLVTAAHQTPATQTTSNALNVTWAFFSSPTQFLVDLHSPGQAPPIRVQLDLRDGGWQVTRIWLPPEILTMANAGS